MISPEPDECESTEPEQNPTTGPMPLDDDGTTIEVRGTGGKVNTLCPLPEGALPIATVETCLYLDESGNQMYAFRFTEGTAGSTLLGLLEVGKHQLFKLM